MMKKFKINWKTVARNLLIIGNIIIVAVLIYIIKTEGISYFSTIGYFD